MIPQNNQQIKQYQNGQPNFGIQYREQDLYPYTKQQFLYQTFNYNQDYIQAFLALSHEIKLKMYLLVEQAKIYGHITDKQSYQDILFKIANASRILKGQGVLPEKQLNANSMQDKINQLCDYEFKKLDINDQWSSPQQHKQFKSNALQNNKPINNDVVTFSPKNQQFNTFSPSNNDQEDFDQFVGVPNHEQHKRKQSSQSFEKDKKSDEDWDWANEQEPKRDLIDFCQQSNKQNKNQLPTFDQLYGTSKPKQPQLPPMKFAWTQTFNEQEKYKERIFDISIDQDEDSWKKTSNSVDNNNFNPFIKQNFDSFQKHEIPIYENILMQKTSQKKIEENEPSIGNSLPQEDQEQFLEFVSEAATGAETNSTHTDVATSVSTGFNIVSGLSLNPSNNQPFYNDGIDYSALYPNNSIAQESKSQQQNVLDLQFLLTNPQKQNQLNFKNEIEKSKSTQQKQVWSINKQIVNSYSEKQEYYHRNDKNDEQNFMGQEQQKQLTEINNFQQIQNPIEQQIKINLQEDQQFGQFQENPANQDIMSISKQQIQQNKISISQNLPQQKKNDIRQQSNEGNYRQKRIKTLSEMDEQADDDQSSNNQNHIQNNQQFQANQQMLKSQNLNYSSKGTLKKQRNYAVQRTDFISKSSLGRYQFQSIEHPLLKPLLVKYKTTELERQIITNSFQYNIQFYEKVIQFVQSLGYTNCPIEYYLKQQLQYVYKIKQLTEMYTNAVQEEQQEKVMEALKKSKQYYSLLNGKKTVQYMNRFFNKMGKGVLYQLAEIVLQSGVSIQHIEKFISTTRNSDTFISNLVTLYIFQKNNNIDSIPAYACKLIQYLLIQYQQYRTQQDNFKNLQYSQQQQVTQSQIYINYIIRLGIISAICRRMIVLMKVCSKGGGNLVKCLKACKQLQINAKQISQQKNKVLPVLWTEQEEQNIIPKQYSNSVINAIKRQQADTILTVLTNIVSQKPVCRLCFGSENLQQMRGTKVHTQCWNLYKKVSEIIKQ